MGFSSGLKLSKIDLLVLVVALVYGVSGSVLTLMMQSPGLSASALTWLSIAGIAVISSMLAVLWYGSRYGSLSIGECGFSLGRGMWVNVGLVIASTLMIARQLEPVMLPTTGRPLWMILGAFTEELVFRVYLIRALSNLMSPRKGHLTWAVLLSAILFTGLHLFRASGSQLLGLFLGSVIVGYVTFLTKSVLFAAYYHVVSNTAGELGLLGGGVTIVAYLVISLYSSWRRGHLMTLSGPQTR